MEPIVTLISDEWADLVQRIGDARGFNRIRFAIDDGGLKIKVNEGVWSPPLGIEEIAS